MIENALTMFRNFRIQDILDIAIISVMISALLIWFKDRASRFVFLGITLLGAIYLLARFFQLYLTTLVLQAFFAILLFVLVVIFQEDLRRFFERLALLGRFRKRILRRHRLQRKRGDHRPDRRRPCPEEDRRPDRPPGGRPPRPPPHRGKQPGRPPEPASLGEHFRSPFDRSRRRRPHRRQPGDAFRLPPAAVGKCRPARQSRSPSHGGARPLGAVGRPLHRRLRGAGKHLAREGGTDRGDRQRLGAPHRTGSLLRKADAPRQTAADPPLAEGKPAGKGDRRCPGLSSLGHLRLSAGDDPPGFHRSHPIPERPGGMGPGGTQGHGGQGHADGHRPGLSAPAPGKPQDFPRPETAPARHPGDHPDRATW